MTIFWLNSKQIVRLVSIICKIFHNKPIGVRVWNTYIWDNIVLISSIFTVNGSSIILWVLQAKKIYLWHLFSMFRRFYFSSIFCIFCETFNINMLVSKNFQIISVYCKALMQQRLQSLIDSSFWQKNFFLSEMQIILIHVTTGWPQNEEFGPK